MNRATPSSVDAERGLIGSMLIDDEIASAAVERLSVDDFYDSDHRSIFGSINDLVRRGAHADTVSVMDRGRH